MLNVVTLSHPGVVRPQNEDAVLWDPGLGLLAVADGMGGHNAGEVASRIALDVLQRSLQSNGGRDAESRLRTAVERANRDIYREARERTECEGMGTTVTALLIEGAKVWFASVGDSRLYVKAAGEVALRLLTRDDSFLGMLGEARGVEPAMLAEHPMRHLLTSVLGPRADVVVEVEALTLSAGELLLMTTDGMHGAVGDPVMDAILDGHEHGADLQVAAEHLLEAALGAGGRDNITLALARYTTG
jgi:serine/threonine protein phosphatase PrpC